MTIDPVTTEVVASRLRETAATMEYARSITAAILPSCGNRRTAPQA
jgi:hypothetical protein